MKPFPDPIYVTRPLLPPLEKVTARLADVWSAQWITNAGAQHDALEAAVRKYLGVAELSLFNNGTIALLCAIGALDLSGEVITTPFTFPATPHALSWSRLTPVFADIDPVRLTLDPARVEERITPKTTGILAVHVYGVPCDVEGLAAVAKKHRLKLVYDAAHAFGVETGDGSVLNHGDLSVLSFHATKVFNTFEGGALVSKDPQAKSRIDWLKNFGHAGETTVVATGINGKMHEFSAAMGLVQLEHLDHVLERRRAVDALYRERLAGVAGIRLLGPSPGERVSNHAYFPILLDGRYPLGRDELNDLLHKSGIRSRRYFYPLISDFPMYRTLPSADRANLPVAADATERVLCLPIYPDLPLETVERIADLVARPAQVQLRAA